MINPIPAILALAALLAGAAWLARRRRVLRMTYSEHGAPVWTADVPLDTDRTTLVADLVGKPTRTVRRWPSRL